MRLPEDAYLLRLYTYYVRLLTKVRLPEDANLLRLYTYHGGILTKVGLPEYAADHKPWDGQPTVFSVRYCCRAIVHRAIAPYSSWCYRS